MRGAAYEMQILVLPSDLTGVRMSGCHGPVLIRQSYTDSNA